MNAVVLTAALTTGAPTNYDVEAEAALALAAIQRQRSSAAAHGTPSMPVAPPGPVVGSLITQPAVGHTHTCRNGHTWDHTMDGGSHICPFCGDVSYVVSNNRFVTVKPGLVSQPAAVYSLPGAGGEFTGCSGAGCSSAGASQSRGLRGGLFGRRR